MGKHVYFCVLGVPGGRIGSCTILVAEDTEEATETFISAYADVSGLPVEMIKERCQIDVRDASQISGYEITVGNYTGTNTMEVHTVGQTDSIH